MKALPHTRATLTPQPEVAQGAAQVDVVPMEGDVDGAHVGAVAVGFVGTQSSPLPRPLASSAGPSALLAARAAKAEQGTLAALLTSLVPARPDLVVLELGASGDNAAAPYTSARAQVTSFVDDAKTANALDALGSYHHVEVFAFHAGAREHTAPLATLGVNAERFDLVIAHAPPPADLETLAQSVAPGGSFVVVSAAKKPTNALLAAAKTAGLTLAARASTRDGVAFVFSKAGQRDPMPIDRTACSDRARVAKLMAAPVSQGPSAIAIIDDDDATLRAQVDAMKRAFAEGVAAGSLDIDNIPLPDRAASSATQGQAKVDALVIFAHPDDESGYAAGAIAKLTGQGKSVHYAVATDGGGGLDALAVDGHSHSDLANIRVQELDGAARALGIDGVTVLGLPDTGMYVDDHRAVPVTAADTFAAWGVDAALEKLVRAIREQRPSAILGFDPTRDPDYGLHGHHLAIGAGIAVAVHLAADPSAFPEQKLAPWLVDEQWAVLPKGARGGRQVSVDVDVAKKRAALESHRTQATSLDGKLAEMGATETWHLFQSRTPIPGVLAD